MWTAFKMACLSTLFEFRPVALFDNRPRCGGSSLPCCPSPGTGVGTAPSSVDWLG